MENTRKLKRLWSEFQDQSTPTTFWNPKKPSASEYPSCYSSTSRQTLSTSKNLAKAHAHVWRGRARGTLWPERCSVFAHVAELILQLQLLEHSQAHWAGTHLRRGLPAPVPGHQETREDAGGEGGGWVIDRKKGGWQSSRKRELRRVSSAGTLCPSLRHPGTPQRPAESGGALRARLMWGVKRSSRGGHLFCVDYPSAAKLPSIYRNEREMK